MCLYGAKNTKEKTQVKNKREERMEVLRKEEEKQELTITRGEVTPPNTT